ncbi:MAG: hypothetical protein GWP05_09780 [Anaerolineaceae bacterium]|nr:hypothetical protein [Anaerolineaceae bacterium]
MAEREPNGKNEERIIIHPNELRPARRTTKPEPAQTSDTRCLWNGWQAIEERDRNNSDAILRQ